MLFSYGFGHAWIFQGVGNEALFLEQFVQRLKDTYMVSWRNDVEKNLKLRSYKEFKMYLTPEKYLTTIKNFFVRQQVAKFRCANHKLAIEEGRYKNILTGTISQNIQTNLVSREYFPLSISLEASSSLLLGTALYISLLSS